MPKLTPENERKIRKEILEIELAEEASNLARLNYSKEHQKLQLKTLDLEGQIAIETQRINTFKETGIGYSKTKAKIASNRRKDLNNELFKTKKLLDDEKKIVELEKKRVKLSKQIWQNTKGTALQMATMGISSTWGFFMELDASIRNVTRELGLSGENAAVLRDNMQSAAQHATLMGGNMKDLSNIMSTFADETGRVKLLSEGALGNIMEMGLGTGMGVEQATRLAGQFELMGSNIERTHKFTQDVVDTTERMGVNTTKVFKNIITNFKQLQRFTFRDGVKGFAEMASYAEKFKVDMGSMLDSAEKARTLEGAVELAAQLQVMGGEFAKSDPFELLFLSRNDPQKYTKKINEMTRGVATFKKNSDGVFETFVSPMDIDRLNQVGKALGMQSGELVTQARRMAEIQKIRQQTGGMFTDKEMQLIEGKALLNEQGTRFTVAIGDQIKDLSKLNEQDLKFLDGEAKSLKQRAIDSKNFQKVLSDTMDQLRLTFMPLLTGLNSILDGWNKWTADWSAAGKGIAAVSLVLAASVTKNLILAKASRMAGSGGMVGGVGTALGGKNIKSAGSSVASKGGGMAALGKGAGIGAAAAGVGTGIMLAAKGIGELAKNMSELDETELAALPKVIWAMAGAIIAFTAPMAIMAATAQVGALGLLALGGAALGIGAGIGIAAAGVGYMAEGFASLSGADLDGVATNILAIGAAAGGAGFLSLVGGGGLGMMAMASSISSMASSSAGMKTVGDSFKDIGVVLQGSSSQFKEIQQTIASIASMEVGSNSALGNLASVLSKPLRVEFADKEVAFNAEINLDMDGEKFFRKHIRMIPSGLKDASNQKD